MAKVIEMKPTLNHPYMEVLNNGLNKIKKFRECLVLRTSLKKNFKDDWERNEHEILLMKTDDEIKAKDLTIRERESYNIEFMNQFIPRLEECDKNFDTVMEKAKSESASAEVKKIISTVNWEAVSSNVEVRVALYERFSKMIEKSEEESKSLEQSKVIIEQEKQIKEEINLENKEKLESIIENTQKGITFEGTVDTIARYINKII